MALKKLELTGFKSFAQKTTLDFSSGIAAVVGPNGSGKSNIIDAVRWILGERKAENIRGAKAEDLIFAGTPNKARVGMARVTITFDNSGKTFPVDFEEVSISRKVARDGISTYYLNDSEVRLKDIVAFFAGSRLGTRGLTIVNQGNSDIFVRATPKERRSMIEEILGLKEYQLKKHDAQRKLISTKFNLEKVSAMIDELMPRLRLLRRQAARFDKQSEIEAELRELEEQYFGFRLGQLEREAQTLKPKFDELSKGIEEGHKALKILEEKQTQVEQSGPKDNNLFEIHKKDRNEILNKRSEVQQNLGRMEAKIELLFSAGSTDMQSQELLTLLEEVWEALDQFVESGDWSSADTDLRPLLDRLEQTLRKAGDKNTAPPKDLEEEREKLLDSLKVLDTKLKEIDERESQMTGDLEQFNVAFKKAFAETDSKRNEIRSLEAEKSRLAFEEEKLKIKRGDLEHLAEQSNRKLEEFKPVSGVLVDLDDAEKRIFKLRAEIAGIGELDSSLIEEAREVEERHGFLSTQVEDLNKASNDLSELIRDLDEKLHSEFTGSMKMINDQFDHFFKLMFGGGRGNLKLTKPEPIKKEEELENMEPEDIQVEDQDSDHSVDHGGIEVEVNIPRKKIKGLEMLSGGERSLVSIAALFALISVSPPPFLVLDEVDAALDEGNARRFADIVRDFSKKTQFVIVTHNRATMEAANILYGVTMGDDGTSKVVSLKLENTPA